MKFDKFWEALTRGVDEEVVEYLLEYEKILHSAYNCGLAEGSRLEKERQYKRRYEQNQLIEATNDFLANTKPLEGKMLEALGDFFDKNAKTKPTLPNRL